jgi:ribosomal protein S18 acetylase RimI-like enzyme
LRRCRVAALRRCGNPLVRQSVEADAVGVQMRDAVSDDHDLLVTLLVEAVNWTGEARTTRQRVMADDELNRYVLGWKRDTDFGVVAVDDDGRPLGALWWRLFTEEAPGYGFVARDVPELSMGVLDGRRGRGVGAALLSAGLDHARATDLSALSLSVEDGNDAARALYERHHFRVVGRSGGSDTMCLDLTQTGA